MVRQHCANPRHRSATGNIHDYLTAQRVPGISGVDTRALTRRLRSAGVMMGMIVVDKSLAEALQLLRQAVNLYVPQRVFNEVQTTLQLEEPWPEWLRVISLTPHEQKEAGMWKEAGDLHAGEAIL